MNSDRKLATILATDCVNFSKHMEENEEKTLRNLKECRKIIDAKIIEFGGRIFKTEGDSVVCEFASPVNCLKAAMEFQNEIYKRNDHSITELKLEWRVGIHVDDVIVEGDNIMGSGVNVSARLESECEPGGILISTIVKDQVNKRLDAKIENDGTRNLKNSGLDYTIFQPSLIFGDSSDKIEFCKQLKNDMLSLPVPAPLFHEGFLPFLGGSFKMSPVHVKDVAMCFVAALKEQKSVGKTYPLGGDELTWKEITKTIAIASDKEECKFGSYSQTLIP